MKKSRVIGIVGGVGPYAGLDLNKKIFDQTKAVTDQQHIPVILVSLSDQIPDRTEFLSGKLKQNPAVPIAKIIKTLSALGVKVVGIPCNTAHAPLIFERVGAILRRNKIHIKVLNMIKETARHIKRAYPEVKSLGLLGTSGTVNADVYGQIMRPLGLDIIYPTEDVQHKLVHDAIYNKKYGIKAQSNPVQARARQQLLKAAVQLKNRGAQLIILGCTEIPLALSGKEISGLPALDPTLILARALIREVAPQKLKDD
jgi:aspartate racemase